MKQSLLRLLRCIKCKYDFSLKIFTRNGGEIYEGKLKCSHCHSEYPIISAVPRILPDEMMDELVWKKYVDFTRKFSSRFSRNKSIHAKTFALKAKSKTSKSFGYEWKKFSEYHGNYTRQFMDWLSPFKPEIFEGKLVLDAGCGMGRHLFVASSYAREIVGVDISEAIDASYKNIRGKKNVHLVQADIYNLPFDSPFDIAYSIGVLHHLPYPEKGFVSLVKHVKKGGKIFVWVYGWENNFVMVRLVEPFRKYFTSKLPHNALYILSYPITFLLEISCLIYRVLNAIPGINSLARKYLPSNTYLMYISKFSFRHKLAIVFDFLSAPLANYYRKEEFKNWFSNAGLVPKIYSHNENSWKALANV